MESNNCPNCGAAITDEKCPYCGTTIFDFSAIDIDKPCFIKIKHGNKLIRTFVEPNGFSVESTPTSSAYYADNAPVYKAFHSDTTIALYFKVLNHKNDVLGKNDVLAEIINMDETNASTKGW